MYLRGCIHGTGPISGQGGGSYLVQQQRNLETRIVYALYDYITRLYYKLIIRVLVHYITSVHPSCSRIPGTRLVALNKHRTSYMCMKSPFSIASISPLLHVY